MQGGPTKALLSCIGGATRAAYQDSPYVRKSDGEQAILLTPTVPRPAFKRNDRNGAIMAAKGGKAAIE